MKINRIILGSIFILSLLLLCNNYALEGYYQDNSVIDLLHNYSPNQIFISGPITDIINDGFEVYNVRNKNSYRVKTNLKVSRSNDLTILGNLNSNNEITCYQNYDI